MGDGAQASPFPLPVIRTPHRVAPILVELMMIRSISAAALAVAALASPAAAQTPRPDQLAFRDLYKELIERDIAGRSRP